MANQELFDGIYNGDQEKVSIAIHKGADVNACETYLSGYTPLTLAFEIGDNTDEIVRLLCLHGADIHLANAWGSTPLLSSLAVKHTTWSKYFLARGACVNVIGIVENRLTTPLHEAAYWGLLNIIEWLIQAGANTEILAHQRMLPQAYAYTNRVNGPIEIARIERAFDSCHAHPIMSLWRHPIDKRYIRFEESTEDLTHRFTTSLKKKDWYNVVLAVEMGAMVDKDIAEMVLDKRYLDA